jgi:hypothetical protein
VAQNPIEESAGAIRKLWEKHGIQNPLRLLGFCLSLLPIPVIQQAGLTLDRHLSDKVLNEELARVWSELESANEAVSRIDNLEEAIAEIASTVQNNESLRHQCEALSAQLGRTTTEFAIDTSDHSYQQLVNSVVQAGRVLISAKSSSVNVIEKTKIQSPSTHLHASGGSRNYVDQTSFTDGSGTVGMEGISTQGNIHVTGNSVGFGNGGTLTFGGNPNEVSGQCPTCNSQVSVDKRQLVGHTQVQCPTCKSVLPFNVG